MHWQIRTLLVNISVTKLCVTKLRRNIEHLSITAGF